VKDQGTSKGGDGVGGGSLLWGAASKAGQSAGERKRRRNGGSHRYMKWGGANSDGRLCPSDVGSDGKWGLVPGAKFQESP